MAKTLRDFTPVNASALADGHLIYLVDPSAGDNGDLVTTLGALRTFLGFTPSPDPEPDPEPDPAPPGTVETPTFSPTSTSFTTSQLVTLSSATVGATIYYTTNGSTPTTASTPYTVPFTLTATTTVRAIAVKTAMNNSAENSATYTLTVSGGGGGGGGSTGGTNPTGFLSLYGVNVAEYPREYITSRMPVRTGALITVAAGGDLQSALNTAQPGDWVVVEAGATFVGNYIIPYKSGDVLSGGNNVIVVTTSAFASLPEKVRVTNATNAAFLVKIKTTNAFNAEALKTTASTSGWRFVGFDFVVDATVATLTRLVSIGNGAGGTQTTTALVPKNIILDRCRFDGHATLNIQRAIALEGIHCGVINSWIGDYIHCIGQDCQGIVAWNTPGPLKIVNCRIQGSSESVMFGAAPTECGMVSDVEFRYNDVGHPVAWRSDGSNWQIKNIFEIKKGRRILIEFNTFHDIWPAAQAGFALLVKHEPYGDESFGQTEDIIFRYNKIYNAASGIDIATIADNNGGTTLYKARRIINLHNIYYDTAIAANNNGSSTYITQLNSTDCVHSHCTFIGDGAASLAIYLYTQARVFYKDCAFGLSQYAVKGDDLGVGNPSITAYDPGGAVSKCLFIVTNVGDFTPLLPSDCYIVGSIAACGFTNAAAKDYSFSSASTFKNQASDGTDLGPNFTILNPGVALAVSGDTSSVQT